MADPETGNQNPPRPAQSHAPSTAASSSPTIPGPTINIGDEFGTAKRNLPPAKILLIAIAAVVVVVAVASFVKRAKPQGSGSLDNVVAVQIPNQELTMVALTFTVTNVGEKLMYVHSIQGKIKTAGGESSGDAVSAVDFDRYFQAFPALKAGIQPALSPEEKIQPGETIKRSVIVTFPINLDAFNQRQSVSVVIQPYDQTVPVTLTK